MAIMTGQAFINEVDISTYGCSLCKGTYEKFLTPPPMKDYIQNQCRSEHGTRVVANASTSRMKEREISFSVFISGSTQADYLTKYNAFLSAITGGIFTLYLPVLGMTYRLLYTDCKQYGDYGVKAGRFTLNVIEPNPNNRQNL